MLHNTSIQFHVNISSIVKMTPHGKPFLQYNLFRGGENDSSSKDKITNLYFMTAEGKPTNCYLLMQRQKGNLISDFNIVH